MIAYIFLHLLWTSLPLCKLVMYSGLRYIYIGITLNPLSTMLTSGLFIYTINTTNSPVAKGLQLPHVKLFTC